MFAVTSGEPAGIGPDLCLTLALEARDAALVCLADIELLRGRAAQLGSVVTLTPWTPGSPVERAAGRLSVLHQPLAAQCVTGVLDPRNGRYVLGLIETAARGCLSGEFAAMVTAPVQKSVINDAGVPFKGHTEYIAELTGAALPVMMLVAGQLRVALATTHLPLRAVPDAITQTGLLTVLRILDHDLKRRWRLTAPRIAVCGLNPHAGERGHLGREEQQVIEPAIAEARAAGIHAEGPFPADTIFVPKHLQPYDAVLAMYHDQGLPVLKHAGFGDAVNVTLGLPIVRTSVDHGTALDLAGTGRAEAGSLHAALTLAMALAPPLAVAR